MDMAEIIIKTLGGLISTMVKSTCLDIFYTDIATLKYFHTTSSVLDCTSSNVLVKQKYKIKVIS